MQSSRLLWSVLNILTKERFEAIKQVFGSLDEAAEHINPEFLRGLGCRNDTVTAVLQKMEEFDRKKEEEEITKHGAAFITIDDPRYPKRLKEIADPPVFLYARGDVSLLDQPSIGLVGTRKMTAYGRRVTEAFVPAFVRSGIVTVSGLAQGIDAEVARQTMEVGGKTIAVLGHGLSDIYPKVNDVLGKKIIESGGLLVSEFPMRTPPEKYMFPARNRIIAGLSLGTVVLEAPEGSGALITARLALDYNRDVFLVPGQIFDEHYRGSHDFIARSQGKLVQSPEEVLRDIGVIAREGPALSAYQPQSPDEASLLAVLTAMPQGVDDLKERSGMTSGVIGATLTVLELHGAVKNIGGGLWVKN